MTATRKPFRPVLLVILDGVGENPRADWNAVVGAKKPNLDALWRDNPWTLIQTSGEDVGLPEGTMGNSEVGHLNIGAGRVVDQSLTRINKSVRAGAPIPLPEGRRLHLMGLLSTGGVHSDISHVEAVLASAAKSAPHREVILHVFLDGRDMPPRSGAELLQRLARAMERSKVGRIGTLAGRYYAMDRDKRWERTEKAWRAMVEGTRPTATDPIQYVRDFYETGRGDEFVEPVAIRGVPGIEDGDGVFFWNYRPDRARQMTKALCEEAFEGFARPTFPRVNYASMVRYEESFRNPVAFPEFDIPNTLSETIARAGLTQFHTAETEKYAHVTYFLNGMREEVQKGEDRVMIPSPKVATYDLQPEMSSEGVNRAVVEAIETGTYGFLIVNYANGDMVGHTGVYEAAVAAVEAVDRGLAKLLPPLFSRGGVAIVTADHGNAEQMRWYETGEPHTQHTTFPVRLCVAGAGAVKLREEGRLADIAPTVLDLLGVEKSAEMTGGSLIEWRFK